MIGLIPGKISGKYTGNFFSKFFRHPVIFDLCSRRSRSNRFEDFWCSNGFRRRYHLSQRLRFTVGGFRCKNYHTWGRPKETALALTTVRSTTALCTRLIHCGYGNLLADVINRLIARCYYRCGGTSALSSRLWHTCPSYLFLHIKW